MALITIGPGDNLLAALEDADPGDVVEFTGTHRVGKVRYLTGVTLRGGDASAVIVSSGVRDVANLRVEDSQGVTLQAFRLRDSTLPEGRALQCFRCSDLLIEDLATGPEVRLDHVHLVSCEGVTLRRLRCDGAGGEMSGNKGAHAVYVAEGCRNVLVEDVEAERMIGAVWQVNAEDGPIEEPITFRRCRAPSWEEGAGFNLLGRIRVELEDITLGDGGNGGIRCYSGASATLARYEIDARPALEGPVTVLETGDPAPPQFGTEPEPPEPPPTDDCEARCAALQAEVDALQAELTRWEAWGAQMPS